MKKGSGWCKFEEGFIYLLRQNGIYHKEVKQHLQVARRKKKQYTKKQKQSTQGKVHSKSERQKRRIGSIQVSKKLECMETHNQLAAYEGNRFSHCFLKTQHHSQGQKGKVLTLFLNIERVGAVTTSSGRAFHTGTTLLAKKF